MIDTERIQLHVVQIEECVFRGTYACPPSIRTTISNIMINIKDEVKMGSNGADLSNFVKAFVDFKVTVATIGGRIQDGGNSSFRVDYKNFLRELERILYINEGGSAPDPWSVQPPTKIPSRGASTGPTAGQEIIAEYELT